ncbi:MAG: type II toxin-antitoxin system HicA family toxin [Pseudomonadota bacterium]
MPKFPIDAPIQRVIQSLEMLGFSMVREGNHIAMIRDNSDGTRTPLTIPNHPTLKSSTLRTILTQSGISRSEFLDVYHKK